MASNLLKKKKRERYSLSELKALGHELLSSRAHINNLPLLLTFVTPTSPPHYVLESLLSLHSFFTPLLPQLPSSSFNSSSSFPQDDPDFIYRTWLRSKFDDFVASLIDIAITSQSEQTLREVVWDTIMEFVKVGNAGKFHSAIYHKFLLSIVHSEFDVDDVLLDLLATKYFKYIDVRYFTYISLEKLARTLELDETSGRKGVPEADGRQSKAGTDIYIKRIHYLLSHVHPMEASDESPEYEMWNGTGIFVKEGNKKKGSEKKETQNMQHNNDVSGDHVLPASKIAKKMKLKFSKAWITFLGLPLPIDVYKEVLVTLHQDVIPHLSNPLMLCDFLTRSYDIGGVISVMSLSSLFVLMTQYGLEYPNFYQKLYGLLEPSIFMAKYRSKFFELLDSCLKSPLLPAYLAAGFTKKLSRLAIMIPPSGALIVIALIHNLLRRHPSINFLVHRENSGETVKYDIGAGVKSCDSTKDPQTSADMRQNKPGIDHFDDEESNPMKTNAMRSSLWEIDTLRHHYCPPVSRFVLSLENDLTVRAKTTEVAVKDFSSGSYGTIFREEIRRRVKQVPLAFYKSTPTSLFSESEFPGWSFKFNEDVGAGPVEDTSPDITELQQNSTKRQRIECS